MNHSIKMLIYLYTYKPKAFTGETWRNDIIYYSYTTITTSTTTTTANHYCHYRYIRKIPKVVSLMGNDDEPPAPEAAHCSPIPSTLRVCAGGMIPSSHNLAEPKVDSLSRSIRAFNWGSTVLPTACMTEESCSGPMTLVRAVGHVQRKRGEYARPLK